ncbi:Protein kinase-like protein [Penicillium odoratum]|uniref:Protein kinase-like protein n=1 Tax=Penicillium odoratum TaxID=1167516 RepID=UPI002546680D|nr:Protein kinase-like protein [Penicillium odoratum]KAJ5745857.1 Protein kinase-like protein [Penicillium odoratum]
MDALSNFQLQNFFTRYSPLTKEICDKVAAKIASGGTVKPTPLQGAQSYTVHITNGTNIFIIQFRGPNSILDLDLLATAQETYGHLVPTCQKITSQHLKGLDPLQVYKMNYIPGDALLQVNKFLHQPENFPLLEQTVQDFAMYTHLYPSRSSSKLDAKESRFSSSAWRNRPSVPSFQSKASIQSEYLSTLERMMKLLPNRFQPLMDRIKSQLPFLFADDYPMVINHWDLLENNIMVDIQTGNLTGIVDWRDAKVGPFAMQFYGLENILGIRKTTCMAFHPRHIELRRLFWKTLYEEMGDVSEEIKAVIQAARMVGIFLGNEFVEASDREDEMHLAVLESMTLDLSDVGL